MLNTAIKTDIFSIKSGYGVIYFCCKILIKCTENSRSSVSLSNLSMLLDLIDSDVMSGSTISAMIFNFLS